MGLNRYRQGAWVQQNYHLAYPVSNQRQYWWWSLGGIWWRTVGFWWFLWNYLDRAAWNRAPRFSDCLWNHFQSSLEDGIQTNNMLESFNKTWNRLAGKYSNVWRIQELLVKQQASSRISFLANTIGQDKSKNTGRKQISMESQGKIKFLVESYWHNSSKWLS